MDVIIKRLHFKTLNMKTLNMYAFEYAQIFECILMFQSLAHNELT